MARQRGTNCGLLQLSKIKSKDDPGVATSLDKIIAVSLSAACTRALALSRPSSCTHSRARSTGPGWDHRWPPRCKHWDQTLDREVQVHWTIAVVSRAVSRQSSTRGHVVPSHRECLTKCDVKTHARIVGLPTSFAGTVNSGRLW